MAHGRLVLFSFFWSTPTWQVASLFFSQPLYPVDFVWHFRLRPGGGSVPTKTTPIFGVRIVWLADQGLEKEKKKKKIPVNHNKHWEVVNCHHSLFLCSFPSFLSFSLVFRSAPALAEHHLPRPPGFSKTLANRKTRNGKAQGQDLPGFHCTFVV